MPPQSQTPLAVIGMACRLPGADDLEAYWELLMEGRSALGELPASRLDQRLYYDPRPGQRGKTYCRIGGVCAYRARDPNCPLPEEVRQNSDLAHVTGCEVAADACRHAGWDPRRLPLSHVGVFVGHTRGSELGNDLAYGTLVGQTSRWLHEIPEFAELHEAEAIRQSLVRKIRDSLPARRAGGVPDASSQHAAGLIARMLNLTGPAVVLNAACSSSLLALAVARRALEQDRIDAAIVGGTTYCKWDNYILYSHAHSASAKGSRPFDAEADGLIASDGYAMLIVKTLQRAIADGDRICAVIRGIGVSSDGRGKSLWAPRKEGQLLAIERAYAGGIDPAQLQYVEAHATSTQVGDATEMNALAEFLKPRLPSGVKIPIGSVKANIGHTLEAAGAASLIKTILALEHGRIPRQINCRRLNPEIDWHSAPFFVATEEQPWPPRRDGRPRQAAVNAFGIGGLNAHIVLEEPGERVRGSGFRVQGSEVRSQESGDRSQGIGDRPSPLTTHHSPLTSSVAIIGASCRFAGAPSLAAFKELIASGKSGIIPVPPQRWNAKEWEGLFTGAGLRGGFITDFEYDWRRHKIPPVQVARANPLQFLVLAAVEEALADANCDLACVDRRRTGVVVGTQFPSDFTHQLQMGMRLPEFQRDLAEELRRHGVAADRGERIAERFASVLLERMPALLDESGSFSTSTLASRVAKTYDLMGGALAVDAGDEAALAAITHALDNLLDGQADLMICAAAQRWMDVVLYQQLALAGRLKNSVPGEGVGVLILKRLADAQRDGDRIDGILRTAEIEALTWPSAAVTAAIGHTLGASGMAALLARLFAQQDEGERGRGGEGERALPHHIAPSRPLAPSPPLPPPLGLLTLTGSPYDMGLAHGRAHAADILRVLRCYADTVGQAWDKLPAIDEAAEEADCYFGPDELAEMEGIAAAVGVAPAAIIAHNLRLYPDMGSGCVQFAIRGGANQPAGLLHAANEDRPAGLMVRGMLVRTIQRRIGARGIAYLAMGVAGEVGGINGVNARGLAVTSSMLLDLPRRAETRRGKLHVVLVNKLLREAASIAEALEVLREHRGTSAWGICLSHHQTDELLYAEYDGARLRTRPIESSLAAANHSLLFDSVAEVPAHSRHRLARLEQLLYPAKEDGVSLPQLQAALRDRFDAARGREAKHPTMNTIRRVDNQISLIFQPAAGQAFVTRGPLADDEDAFIELDLRALLPADRAPPLPLGEGRGEGLEVSASGAETPTDAPHPNPLPKGEGTLATPRVCQRYVLCVAPADRAPCKPKPIRGTVIIFGGGPLGEALAEPFHSRRCRAVLLDPAKNEQQVLADVDALTAGTDPVHLLLASPHYVPAGNDRTSWHERREPGVVLPYLVCQRWYSRLLANGRLADSSLTAVTALGGRFGLDRHAEPSARRASGPHAAESGALAGLVKAVWFETGMNGPGLAAKVIDLDPAEPPQQLASYVLEELDRGQPEVEIGYANGRRYVVRPEAADVGQAAGLPNAFAIGKLPVTTNETWIVTGGARGVTAVAARELGRRLGIKLHLIGSSPPPDIDPAWRDLSPEATRELKARMTRQALAQKKIPAQLWQQVERAIEIDRNLRLMAAAGVRATYHACDVADRAALARTLDAIRAADGPIQGIVHGAGVELSCRFERKRREMLEKTLAAKVDGAVNLLELTGDDPLRWFLAFGSISGRFGNFGQTDYSLANEALSKLVSGLAGERPGLRATTFQWHSWAEVGMAVRPESLHAKKQKNMKFMPTLEGANYLLDELLAGLPEPEVLITDPDYFRGFYPGQP